MSGTAIWGPTFWKTIHFVVRTFPDEPTTEQQEHYASFMKSIGHVLPCPMCRGHYNDYVKDTNWDEVVKTKNNFTIFVIKLHNSINARTGKPEYDIPVAIEMIHADTNGDLPNTNNGSIFYYSIGIAIFILLIWFVLFKTELTK